MRLSVVQWQTRLLYQSNTPTSIKHRCLCASTSIAHFTTTSTSHNDDQKKPSSTAEMAAATAAKEAKSESKATRLADQMLKEDERIRQLLLDRDGGSASVPTREGKWDQEMGRETSRQMHRILDQVRVNRPGTDTSAGEGESKWFSRR